MLEVIEALAQSKENPEDTAQEASDNGENSARVIKSISIKDVETTSGKDAKIAHERLTAKVSFLLGQS